MIDEEKYREKLKNICNEYINPYGDEIILDGKFKLDELKQIVNIMEEFLNQKILKCDFGTEKEVIIMDEIKIIKGDYETKDDYYTEWYRCSECGRAYISPIMNYCPICGRKIVWE